MKNRYIIGFVLAIFILCIGHRVHSLQTKTSDTEYWPDGKVRTVTEYNEMGGLEAISYYREDGTLEQEIKYDMDGHKIKESNYNSEGKLRDNADGWAVIKNQYEDGKLRVESYYGADGRLKEQKEYNKLGDLVGKQYVGDDDILPAEEYNPLPTSAGESTTYYDSFGMKEGSTSAVSGTGFYPYWRIPEGEEDN